MSLDLGSKGVFSIEFDRDYSKNYGGDFVCRVINDKDEVEFEAEGPDFLDAFAHAMIEADRNLAYLVVPEYLEGWSDFDYEPEEGNNYE